MNETKKYLDYNGLETLVNIIKGTYAEKTDLSLVSQVATNAAQAATTLESSKQDKLIAGSNIQIAEDGKTISATDTTYVDATTSTSGLMSATDKTKLDGVATGAQVNTIEGVQVDGVDLVPDSNKKVNVALANTYLKDWSIDRLGKTDGAILRMGIYEMLYTDTPDVVCINEAILLAKEYSDEKVKNMINAVLDGIMKNKDVLG